MRRSFRPITLLAATAALALIAPSCLDRPVTNASPVIQTNFTAVVDNKAVDKIDILFVIDNSASMGDKQEYLGQAVPDLITRLVTPNCVDTTSGTIYGPSDAQGNGTCTQGTVEFPPVHDMHIGVLSTSLGSRLSDQYGDGSGIICDPNKTLTINGATISNNNDDRGELLNRSGPTETPLADAGTSFYLNWFPATNPKNQGKTASAGAPPISDATRLITDFTSLVQGVGNYGCGIESQLESWYRFLIQPDPYDSLAVDRRQGAMERRRRDDPGAAPQLPETGLTGGHHRHDRRERFRARSSGPSTAKGTCGWRRTSTRPVARRIARRTLRTRD